MSREDLAADDASPILRTAAEALLAELAADGIRLRLEAGVIRWTGGDRLTLPQLRLITTLTPALTTILSENGGTA